MFSIHRRAGRAAEAVERLIGIHPVDRRGKRARVLDPTGRVADSSNCRVMRKRRRFGKRRLCRHPLNGSGLGSGRPGLAANSEQAALLENVYPWGSCRWPSSNDGIQSSKHPSFGRGSNDGCEGAAREYGLAFAGGGGES